MSPNGYPGDATEPLLAQIERFAPGLRERIVAQATRSPAELQTYNANYLGGDINTGANDPLQLAFRPHPALDPYSAGIPGLFICSAATPPGPGVHGMSGFNARPLGAALAGGWGGLGSARRCPATIPEPRAARPIRSRVQRLAPRLRRPRARSRWRPHSTGCNPEQLAPSMRVTCASLATWSGSPAVTTNVTDV